MRSQPAHPSRPNDCTPFEHRLFLTARRTTASGVLHLALELLDDQRFARGVQPTGTARPSDGAELKTDITTPTERVFPERRLEALEVDYSDEERRITRLSWSTPSSGSSNREEVAATRPSSSSAPQEALVLFPAAFAGR